MKMMKVMTEQTAGLAPAGRRGTRSRLCRRGVLRRVLGSRSQRLGRRGGQPLIQEAGGLIGDLAGEGDFLHGGQVIAAAPKIFAQIVTALAPFRTELVRERAAKVVGAVALAKRPSRPRGALNAVPLYRPSPQ
jgi:myo-inositol-1(or 4)-monophosphatase